MLLIFQCLNGVAFMVCSRPQMLADFRQIINEWKSRDDSSSRPGQFVIERAFVGR